MNGEIWHVVAWIPDVDPYRPARSLVSACAPTHARACALADWIADAIAAHGPRGVIVEVFQADAGVA
jgi:hypothetical protein